MTVSIVPSHVLYGARLAHDPGYVLDVFFYKLLQVLSELQLPVEHKSSEVLICSKLARSSERVASYACRHLLVCELSYWASKACGVNVAAVPVLLLVQLFQDF